VKSQLRPCLILFTLLTILTGVAYPLLVTLIAQIAFPHQANGSVILQDGKPVGSQLIGQPFEGAGWFWGRPSATTPFPYNSASSTGSNLGPTNPDLVKAFADRIETLRKAHPERTGPVPADLVTASASGLDPHISPAAAEYQVPRVARERGLSEDRVRRLVATHTEGRQLSLLGEPRVCVLTLNLALQHEK
jgi:K+-transporting ATPase ATPase C chain